MIKSFFSLIAILYLLPNTGWTQVPKVQIEYSYALDMYCPQKVDPEFLTPSQLQLIPKIPEYRKELLSKVSWFQSQWNQQGQPLLTQTVRVIGKPFPMKDIQASVFLCPRFPFMGTPLAFNVISYLNSSAKDIEGLNGNPMPVFFFVSTAFHEVLHKYINSILEKRPSAILAKLNETDLYEAHLHVFALQKLVFESLGLGYLLPQIQQLEALHGPDYVRAWKAIHDDSNFYAALIAELKITGPSSSAI